MRMTQMGPRTTAATFVECISMHHLLSSTADGFVHFHAPWKTGDPVALDGLDSSLA